MNGLVIITFLLTIYLIYYINNELQLQAGPQGPIGLEGPMGPMGLDGPMGPIGPIGPKGDRGPKGDKGDKGDQGIQGIRGLPGVKGDKGDQGQRGPAGYASEKGDPGPRGEMGPKGDTGPRGEKGDKGDRGPKGDKGERGEQGYKGDKGDKGDKGNPGDGKYDKTFDFVLGSADNKTRGDSGSSRALVKVHGGKLVINYDNDFNQVEINSNKNPLRLLGKVEVEDDLNVKGSATFGQKTTGKYGSKINIIGGKNEGGYIDFRDHNNKRQSYFMGKDYGAHLTGKLKVDDGISGMGRWNADAYNYKNFNSSKHKNLGGHWRMCPAGKYMCGVHKSGGNGNINNMRCCSFHK